MKRLLLILSTLALMLFDSCQKEKTEENEKPIENSAYRPIEITYVTAEREDEKATFIYDGNNLIRKEWYDAEFEIDELISKTEFDYSKWNLKTIQSLEFWKNSTDDWELSTDVSYVFKDGFLSQITSKDGSGSLKFFYNNSKITKIEAVNSGSELNNMQIDITYQNGTKKVSTFSSNTKKLAEFSYQYDNGKIVSLTHKHYNNGVLNPEESEMLTYYYIGEKISKITLVEYIGLKINTSDIIFKYDNNGNLTNETWISAGKYIWDFRYKFEPGISNSLFLIDYGEMYINKLLCDFPPFTVNYFFDYFSF